MSARLWKHRRQEAAPSRLLGKDGPWGTPSHPSRPPVIVNAKPYPGLSVVRFIDSVRPCSGIDRSQLAGKGVGVRSVDDCRRPMSSAEERAFADTIGSQVGFWKCLSDGQVVSEVRPPLQVWRENSDIHDPINSPVEDGRPVQSRTILLGRPKR